MGWSCAQAAGFRMDAWSAKCIEQTGSQNVFESNGHRYFFEASRREHPDGAITGTIYRFLGDTKCQNAGSFRIEGDGTVSRAPKFLKDTKVYLLFVDGCRTVWRGKTHPTNETLEHEMVNEWSKQYMPGGVNAHISKAIGYIPHPHRADVIDLDTGKVVASWEAATFQVFGT